MDTKDLELLFSMITTEIVKDDFVNDTIIDYMVKVFEEALLKETLTEDSKKFIDDNIDKMPQAIKELYKEISTDN